MHSHYAQHPPAVLQLAIRSPLPALLRQTIHRRVCCQQPSQQAELQLRASAWGHAPWAASDPLAAALALVLVSAADLHCQAEVTQHIHVTWGIKSAPLPSPVDSQGCVVTSAYDSTQAACMWCGTYRQVRMAGLLQMLRQFGLLRKGGAFPEGLVLQQALSAANAPQSMLCSRAH